MQPRPQYSPGEKPAFEYGSEEPQRLRSSRTWSCDERGAGVIIAPCAATYAGRKRRVWLRIVLKIVRFPTREEAGVRVHTCHTSEFHVRAECPTSSSHRCLVSGRHSSNGAMQLSGPEFLQP